VARQRPDHDRLQYSEREGSSGRGGGSRRAYDTARMPTLLHPGDPAFHQMVTAFEGEAEPWLALNRALRDAMISYAAERSPYYRSVIRPGMPFGEIPILTKEVLRERYEDLIAEGVHRDRWAPSRTAGSFGRPADFLRDTAQGYLENISALRFLRWMHDVPPEAATVWVSASASGPAARGIGARRGGGPRMHHVPTGTLTPERFRREVRTWSRLGTYFLYGFASAIEWMARQAKRQGLQIPPPVCIVTTSETLTGNAEARIRGAFGVPVHSWYGSREMNGYVAGTLPGTRTYAVNPLLVHLEILDADGGPAGPGEQGRVVLTDLNNLVMPFIRYDMRDLAIPSLQRTTGGFPLIGELVGRAAEVVDLPSGRTLSAVTLSQTLFTIHGFAPDIDFYQCAKVGPNELEIRVVWARPTPPERVAALAEAARSAADPDTLVSVREVAEVDRLPSGKAWLLRDETVSPR
jgi:phenylacetate-CoA ligase